MFFCCTIKNTVQLNLNLLYNKHVKCRRFFGKSHRKFLEGPTFAVLAGAIAALQDGQRGGARHVPHGEDLSGGFSEGRSQVMAG